MNLSTIRGAYSSLNERFVDACASDGLTVRPDRSAFTFSNTGKGQVEVSSLFFLPNWHYRVGSTKKIDILVSSKEILSCKEEQVVFSGVGVRYLKQDGNEKARVLLEVHYDYLKKVQTAHPVFHAQIDNVDFDSTKLADLGFTKEEHRLQEGQYSGLKIPTPYMNIGSVLLLLAADHMKESSFRSFLEDIKKSECTKWQVACEPLHGILHGNVRPHSWYTDIPEKK